MLIYLTDPAARDMAAFDHSGQSCEFRELTPATPIASDGEPSWLFIDWFLPEMSGLELCRRIRADGQRGAEVRIVMVLDSASSDAERARALSTGADDYMIGPISRAAALDRILAAHPASRAIGAAQSIIAGKLVIDTAAMRASWDGRIVHLPMREFRLLQFLAQNPDRVLTRGEILDALAAGGADLDPRTVDVWILRLRKALDEVGAGRHLRTIRQVGYAFDTI